MDLVDALQAPDRARRLKLVLGKQITQMGLAMSGMADSVILDERNKHALKVLKEQVDAGRKNIAIFYGAAHLAGMDELMTGLMGFKPHGDPVWITAWDLAEKR
jgi:hypothetical protein